MIKLNKWESLGMIETGNHSIYEWEVVETKNGTICFISHDDEEICSLEEVQEMFDFKGDDTLKSQLDELGVEI